MKKRLFASTLVAAALALVFLGCSSASSNAPQLSPTAGQHPTGWVQDHWVQFVTNPTSCVACHGDLPAMAAYTRALPVNPHARPAKAGHPGPFACTECHRQHKPPVVKCLECHPTFKMTAK